VFRSKERPEEEEEVAEHKATFLEASRKYINQFDTENNITVMCSKVENKLYRLRKEKSKRQVKEIVYLHVYYICQSFQVNAEICLETRHEHFYCIFSIHQV
jgi:hypothetical protein